jgi:hypothetical protein
MSNTNTMKRPIDPDLDDMPKVHRMDLETLRINLYNAARELAEERTANRGLRMEIEAWNRIREDSFGLPERLEKMERDELADRVLCQRDYLRRFYGCLDGLPLPSGSQGMEGARDYNAIRAIVEKLIENLQPPK